MTYLLDTSLESLIIKAPRMFDRDCAKDAEPLVAGFAPKLRDVCLGAVSTSPYLASLLTREAEWLAAAADAPKTALAQEVADIRSTDDAQLGARLRQGKRRVALLTGIADLGGAWSLKQVTGALSDFADAACDIALRSAIGAQIRRGKLAEDDETAGMTVLAMGKMGAGELNYSSDIDLICLFDETRFDVDDFYDARAALIKATRAMSALLSEPTAEGYVFRTDLRLRPDPAVTPVCVGMEAAERYYESLGRTWERAAYIKARACAGDIAGGETFLKTLTPFVWRRHLDFAAIQDAHDMRLAIREHKGLGGPITLPGHNMKLGRGGIREIEFFTQTRQLIAGGRDPDLRMRGTLEGLKALAAKDWVPSNVAETLSDHYIAHRTVEHRCQMVRDAQTHDLPQTAEGFDRLAAMMDMDVATLEADLNRRLSEVHELMENFFVASRAPRETTQEAHVFDEAVLDRWPSYPALRSTRGAELFETLKPDLLSRLSRASKPDEALLAFDGFLSGLPAGVQLFSLLAANPQLTDLLLDVVVTSPALGAHLSRNAQVLDAVIGGDFFDEWPGLKALTEQLSELLLRESDYETQLDTARGWAREWHFRIGVHHLRGLTDAVVAGSQYSDLARAVLQSLWPVVVKQFSVRHGPPPGVGAAILGMGSLGSGQLTAVSDLDIIVIYDAAGVEMSSGPKSLAARQYYARLTQAMITAMTAPMSRGKLYELDMRLRPSGNKGPVATSIEAFREYQTNEAWVWEHLAQTRADLIVGPSALCDEIAAVRDQLLQKGHSHSDILAETAKMRAKIAAAKKSFGSLDAKIGPGRLQDLELFSQAGALVCGVGAQVTPEGIKAATSAGLINDAQRDELIEVHRLIWALQSATRLLSAQPLDPNELGAAATSFLVRVLDTDDLASGLQKLENSYRSADEIITSALTNQTE